MVSAICIVDEVQFGQLQRINSWHQESSSAYTGPTPDCLRCLGNLLPVRLEATTKKHNLFGLSSMFPGNSRIKLFEPNRRHLQTSGLRIQPHTWRPASLLERTVSIPVYVCTQYVPVSSQAHRQELAQGPFPSAPFLHLP